mgnify:CR=1 FL=1
MKNGFLKVCTLSPALRVADCAYNTQETIAAMQQAALDAAGIAQVRQWAQTVVECPYPLLERVKLEIAAAQGILGEVSYGAQVRLPALLPVEHWPAYAARITELTAGKIAAEKLGETFQAAPVEAR